MDQVLIKLRKRPGGLSRLAVELGIKQPSISSWRKVPPLRVIDIERITGIPRTELRPDLYPPERRKS